MTKQISVVNTIGRFAVAASLLAWGVACVNLDKPQKVSECLAEGRCENGKADSRPGENDALPGKEPDGPALAPDGGGVGNHDGSGEGAGGGPDSGSGVDGAQADVPVGGGDGPQSLPDLPASEVPLGGCALAGLPRPAGTVCRYAAGPCDVDEVCDGVGFDCPADKLAAASTPCRPVAGDCDIAETCDGTRAVCPPDGFKAAGTLCRGAVGTCDVAESCDGAKPACPVDSVAPSTTVCRPSPDNNQCDPAETCDGTDTTCPADVRYARPATPTGVQAVAGNLQVTVSWTKSGGATGYNVKQSTTAGTGYTTLASPPTTTAYEYVDKGLAGGITYYYKVSAINTVVSCESTDSSELSVTPTGPCTPPSPPVITATSGNGSITLNWAASPGAVSYSVARSQTAGTGYAIIGTVTTGTTFIDRNVSSGSTYHYVVTASNGTCSSVNSSEASSSPSCTAPLAPAELVARPADGSVTLNWTASAGAVTYSIYRSDTGAEPFRFVNSTAQTTFTDSDVKDGTKYYYVVRASNGLCASGNSGIVSVTPACVPPPAPAGIIVTPGDKQLSLSWAAAAGATQYRVSRSTTGTEPFTEIATPSTTNYVDKPLTNGTTYYYVVGASNGSCWSGLSEVVSGMPICTPPAPPGAPTATPGDGQVSLSWPSSPGATIYIVWRKTGSTGSYATLGTSTSTTYTDKSLANGTTYYYAIAASNGSCESARGDEQSATPVAACSQSKPGNVRATPSGSVQIALTWTAASPEPSTYSIARSATSGTGYISIGSVAGNVLTYIDTDTTLIRNRTYYYQIAANGSCTATSAEVYATTSCVNPPAPATPTVVSNLSGAGAGSIAVAWPAVDGATAYTVYRDTSPGGAFADAVSTNQSAATFTDPAGELENGATYYYVVSASNAGGQCVSAKSEVGSAMSCAPPAVPIGLKAAVGTSKQVRLSWTASTGATQYTILRGSSSGGEAIVGTVASPTTSYTDTDVTDWTAYYYQVSAQNGRNNACSSAASSEVKATPNGCPVLGAGTNAYVGNTTNAYCFVTCWDLPPGVAGVGLTSYNYAGRTLTINDVPVNCNPDCALPSSLKKDTSVYPTTGSYLFKVSQGSWTSAGNTWWSTTPGRDCQ